MNDMEWGGIYWSNFAGLSGVTSSMQTQRGLGAAIISAPSIGGTINITTRGLDAKKGGSFWYGMGNDALNDVGFSVSTGLMKMAGQSACSVATAGATDISRARNLVHGTISSISPKNSAIAISSH